MTQNDINEKIEYCKNNMKMFDTLDEATNAGREIVVKHGHDMQYLCMNEGELTLVWSFRDEDTEEIVTMWFSLVEGITSGRTIYCLLYREISYKF